MVDHLIVTADRSAHGRGVRGHTLTRFLRTYFGFHNVRQISPGRLRQIGAVQAGTVYVGLPSSLTEADLALLHCRRLALFDYHDSNDLALNDSQQEWLKPQAVIYLKPWMDDQWHYDIRLGLLPIRRYRRFSYALRWERQKAQWIGRHRRELRKETTYDVAFVGNANQTEIYQDGQSILLEQRAEWVHAIKSEMPELRFWGGLIGVREARRARLQQRFGNASQLICSTEKIDFPTYFRALAHSKVLLAPGGNVPWTYRHYESLYCGAVVVTIDFRRRQLLVPLPGDGLVHVPDHGSVLPAIERALELWEELPDLSERNYAHLERYWRHATNSKSRPQLIHRFLAQLTEVRQPAPYPALLQQAR